MTAATTSGGLRGLLEQLEALHAAGDSALLGIVVATEGSTYQKRGALVLLDRAGLRHGVISGGCLEPELERRARAVFASGRAAVVDFDTRSDEDLVFGSGTGCRGRVHLLLLPQPPQAPLAQALARAAAGDAAVSVRLSLAGDSCGAGTASVGQGTSSSAWRWDGRGAATASPPDSLPFEWTIAPPPAILLLGAGPETPLLLEFARRFGWRATVVEHRQRWSAFAAVDGSGAGLVACAPGDVAGALGERRFDAAIVMSHNFAIDLQHLRFCAGANLAYVGLLGPGARRDALLGELGAAADRLHPRLRAPVGLDLGGSGPEAIALAIAAELHRFFAARP